jgi:hypothetical protein
MNMQDDLDMDMLIDQLEGCNLFDNLQEYELLCNNYNISYNAPSTIIHDVVYNTYIRYRRYRKFIIFDDNTDHILDMINDFLDSNRSQNDYYDFLFMKKIDGEILHSLEKNKQPK